MTSQKKILLVDDNPLFLKVLVQAFTKAGFKCESFESGYAALEYLAQTKPDVILSDYEMPGMNGLDFRRELMKDTVLRDIPFVFLTYTSDNSLMTEGLGLQAVDYVIKSTPVKFLVTKIHNLLDTVQKQRELSSLELKKAARALNIKSIPSKSPKINGFDIDFWHQSYQDIPGGDFIDFVEIDNRYTFIVLGDIMGKKWTAWFFTFSFLSYIRAAIRFGLHSNDYSPASLLQKVNNMICYDEVLKDILSSLSLIMIDQQTGRISYSGAGDLPLLYYHADAGKLSQVTSSGLLLGLFAEGDYEDQYLNMLENDQLFIFTDGMTDFAENENQKSDYQLFSRGLNDLLHQKKSFNQIKETFILGIERQIDDCSIICIHKQSEVKELIDSNGEEVLHLEKTFELPNEGSLLTQQIIQILEYIEHNVPIKSEQLLFKSKYILTELLTNSLKHSGTESTKIELCFYESYFTINKIDVGKPIELLIQYQHPNQQVKLTSDAIHSLYAVFINQHTVNFISNENDFDEKLDINDIMEHFGFLIITKTSEKFSYNYNTENSSNNFNISISY